jgi:ankyrin repeat protein
MRAISKTSFLEAVRNWEAKEVSEALRQRPEFASVTDSRGRTPLHVCANRALRSTSESASAVATAKALVKAGADVNAVQPIPDDGEIFRATALWYALAWGRNRTLASYLLKCKANPNHCMFALVYADDLTSAKLVKRHGAKIDEVFDGETPLIYAARHRRDKFVEWLLKEGANPNFRDRRGLSALHHAVRRRLSDSTLRALQNAGADTRAVSNDGVSVARLATRAQKEFLGLDDA